MRPIATSSRPTKGSGIAGLSVGKINAWRSKTAVTFDRRKSTVVQKQTIRPTFKRDFEGGDRVQSAESAPR